MNISFLSLFRKSVQEFSNLPALDWKGNQVTYGDLDRQSTMLACLILNSFPDKQKTVAAVLMEKSDQFIILIMAMIKAGICYVPIDPVSPAERSRVMVNEAGAGIILSDKKNHDAAVLLGKPVTLFEAFDLSAKKDDCTEIPAVYEDEPMYIVFTSGTTGKPKGIKTKYSNVAHYLHWCLEHFDEHRFSISICASSVGFDLFTLEVFYPLCIGKKLVLADTPQLLGLYVKRIKEKCLVCTVPSVLAEIVKTGIPLSCISDLVLTGEKAPANLLEHLLAADHGMNIWNLYGPTETTVTCAVMKIKSPADNSTIGKPISGTQIIILNEWLEECAVNEKGDIYIGGGGVAAGYTEQSLSANYFLTIPGYTGIFYKTGDIGFLDTQHNIRLCGRKDDQVKINGVRIELSEIEEALHAHPLVTKSVVLKEDRDSARNSLVGFIFSTARITGEELQDFLADKLPAGVIPRRWIMNNRITLSKNGKVDKEELLKLLKNESNE
jgi:amino acid adenylation domain-containing protein